MIARPLAGAVALVAVAGACGSHASLTQIVVVADTNMAIPQQIDEIDIEVTGPAGQTSTAAAPLAGDQAIAPPLTLALTPGAGALSPLLVRVVGKIGGEAIIERAARTGFVGSDSRALMMTLTTSCIPVTCGDGQTCDGTGACTSVDVSPDALAEWNGAPPGRMPQGGGGAGVTAMAIGETHACLLTTSRRVLCWGADDTGQVGDPALAQCLAPRLVAGVAAATSVTSAPGYSCALSGDGTASCWGADDFGQLGDGGGGAGVWSAAPKAVVGLAGAMRIDAGEGHACALDGSGNVWCWGRNDHGQVGDGTTIDRSRAARVSLSGPVAKIAVGEDHTCALLATGGVQCWGSDEYGQLGDGSTTNSPVPRVVAGLTDVKDLDTGSYHTCAVRAQRVVSCWGRNNHGQLGDAHASGDYSSLPVAVQRLSDSRNVVAGELHTCARSENGTVSCWGDGEFGQIGNGATADSNVPVTIAFASGFIADELASGNWSACARRAGGAMRCWGRNDHGQLGDGTTTNRTTPVDVIGLP